jgi:hypothetical protein
MAIIKFGPTIIGARGTIAGTVFSANKSGAYARSWAKGANPQTQLQQRPRSTLTVLALRWATLSQAFRDTWITYAAQPGQELTNSLGETYFATGFNWYTALNIHRDNFGLSPDDEIADPAPPAIVTPSAISVNATPINSAEITYPVIIAAGNDASFFAQLISSRGRLVASNRAYVLVHTIERANPTMFVTITNLDDFFGPITTSQSIWIRTYEQGRQGRRNAGAVIAGEAV